MDGIEADAQLKRVVRQGLAATAAVTGLMVAWSLFAGAQLPGDEALPVRWDVAGEPNAFASKPFALFFPPALTAGLGGLLALIPVIDPRRRHMAQSASFLRMAWCGLLAVLLTIHLASGLYYLGVPVPMDRVVVTVVGCLFVALGNLLGKVRSNFFMGVRTPWTLSSEYTWTKTNRLTGRVMVVGGLGIALSGLLFGGGAALAAVGAAVASILVVAVGYSYAVWRTAPDRDEGQMAP